MDTNGSKERVTTVISQRLPNFIVPHLAPKGDLRYAKEYGMSNSKVQA
jgi:hypothetical protein